MISTQECIDYFGYPTANAPYVGIFSCQSLTNRLFQNLPINFFANRLLFTPLSHALQSVLHHNLEHSIISFDGCFDIRPKTGCDDLSLHSWALAIDINASENQWNKRPNMNPALVKCFTDAGFDWGGYWRIPDGMHFQLAKLPPKIA